MTSLLQIIYASTSGHTETVVEAVAKHWQAAGINLKLQRAEQTDPSVLADNSTFLLATSTWEHGEINPFFVPLYEAMAKLDCHGKRAAFIGLGDRRYEPVLFCGGLEKVRQRWLDQGGSQIGDTLKIQGEPFKVLDTLVAEWARVTLPLLDAEATSEARPVLGAGNDTPQLSAPTPRTSVMSHLKQILKV